jgi:hypothetical protein
LRFSHQWVWRVVMPCTPVEVHLCSGGTCYLHFQQKASRALFLPGFLIDIFFNPEDGGSRFLQRPKHCLFYASFWFLSCLSLQPWRQWARVYQKLVHYYQTTLCYLPHYKII